MMDEWIPFEDGEYLVEQAYIISPDESEIAVVLKDSRINVYTDKKGIKQLSGSGRVHNTRLLKLLDDHDDLNMLLDLGYEFKYILKNPILKGGKVFSLKVKSFLQFSPREAWQQIPEDEFDALCSRLRLITE
jgi:hypothetical protein